MRTEDEVGQLAAQFNAMLDALDRSQRAQRRLVADASHELRTPVTSVRANIELLAEGLVPDEERGELLADVREQVEELSALVVDLIELARGDEPVAEVEDVRLDAVVAEAVQRARRHAPAVRFAEELEPVVVEGVPDRLARAVNNLLDNAARHSPPGGTVEVRAGPDGIRVRDHGEGDRAGGSRPAVRALLPRRRRAREAGHRARPRHRPPGRRGARRARERRQRAGRRCGVRARAAGRARARVR